MLINVFLNRKKNIFEIRAQTSGIYDIKPVAYNMPKRKEGHLA